MLHITGSEKRLGLRSFQIASAIMVQATPQQVWDVFSDAKGWPAWSRVCTGVWGLSPDLWAVGARLSFRLRIAHVSVPFSVRITEPCSKSKEGAGNASSRWGSGGIPQKQLSPLSESERGPGGEVQGPLEQSPITESQPPHKVAWTSTEFTVTAVRTFTFDAQDGGTLVTDHKRFSSPVLPIGLWYPRRLIRTMTNAWLSDLKAEAERRAARP